MEYISLRFVGNGVAPSTTRCKELAAVIAATEDLISSLSEGGDSQISLVSLEDKSLGLKYAAIHMAAALAIWGDLAAVINAKRFESLNAKTRQALSEIVSFVKKKDCKAYFGDSVHDTLAIFDSRIALPADLKFKGRSSLIGEVVRVGGDEPKVRLRLPSGIVLTCDTKEKIAKELGHRLYENVSCKGVATWDYTTGEILKFKIEEVGAFKRVLASKAFESLAAAMPSTIRRLRSEGIQYAS